MRVTIPLLVLSLFTTLLFCGHTSDGANTSRSFEMGMIYWPPQGETTSPTLIGKGIGLAVTNSDHLLVQLPWSPAQTNLAEKARWISMIARENHKHLTISVDWQDPTRTSVLGGRINPWRFADERTRRQFLRSVEDTASKHHPDFIVLGVEVNYYAHLFPDDFAVFTRIFHEARAQIKKLSPQTKVLVTFQYEFLTGRDASWGVRGNFSPINAFGADLDMLGISTYPFLASEEPDAVSQQYFAALNSFHLPIGFFETAWPTILSVAQKPQAEYARHILAVCNEMKVRLLIWTATTDTSQPNPDGVPPHDHWMQFLGLWKMNGDAKQAVEIWQQWRALPLTLDQYSR